MRLFSMKLGWVRVRLAQTGAVLTAAAFMAGCGNSYRPVVTPVIPSGPPAEVSSHVAVVSAPSESTSGVATIIDWSGDAIMAYALIGVGPLNLTLDETASTGYTYNRNGTITSFPISDTSLLAKNIAYSTPPSGATLLNMSAPSAGMWATDIANNAVDYFNSSPMAFKQAIPVATSPIMVAGSYTASGQRQYVIAQNFTDSTGVACNTAPTAQTAGVVVPIETSSMTADPAIAVGKCPVFAVQTPDLARLFVINRGDDTITVINTINNASDSCTPYQNRAGAWITCHPTIQLPAGSGPVYAEYNATIQKLIVANYDGGTISVIDVPLDEYGNDANTYANGTCTNYADCGAVTGGFGTVHTIPVGKYSSTPYPASVTVLYDGSRAYSANQGDEDGSGNGTVSVVNLSSYTVEKTISVVGHPRTVVSTQNSTLAKIYAGAPDSPYLTIIKDAGTASDSIDTTVRVTGNIVDVRTTTKNGSTGNYLDTSLMPGYGTPCTLPPSMLPTPDLTTCRQIP